MTTNQTQYRAVWNAEKLVNDSFQTVEVSTRWYDSENELHSRFDVAAQHAQIVTRAKPVLVRPF